MKHYFSDLKKFRHDPLNFILERGKQSEGPLTKLHLGPAPIYLATDPNIIKPVLSWSEDEINKGRFIKKLRPAFGDSSLSLSGEEHQRRRHVLHKRLAKGEVLRLVPEMAASIRREIGYLSQQQNFDAHTITGPLTLRMICIALFGEQLLSPGDEQALVSAVHLMEEEIAEDMFRVLPRGPVSHYRRQQNYRRARQTMSLIVKRVQERAPENSVLQSLQGLGLDEIQIRDEILTMLLAGHHTTAGAAAWLFYYLATVPGLADKIAAEAYSICDDEGEIRPSALKDAKASLSLVKEILRLFPSAWWFSREVMRPVELEGIKLKRGTSIIICPWQLHRDSRHWDNPEELQLDRNHSNPAYLPFGIGPRTCVGMGVALLELQLLALELAASCRISFDGEVPEAWPEASVTLIPPKTNIVLRPRIGRHELSLVQSTEPPKFEENAEFNKKTAGGARFR